VAPAVSGLGAWGSTGAWRSHSRRAYFANEEPGSGFEGNSNTYLPTSRTKKAPNVLVPTFRSAPARFQRHQYPARRQPYPSQPYPSRTSFARRVVTTFEFYNGATGNLGEQF
jgi:hypothetical protein